MSNSNLHTEILAAIISEIENIIADSDTVVSVSSETPLLGENAIMDSVGLVSLLVFLEDYLDEKHDVAFDWTSDSAMSLMNSFMRSPNTLVEHVVASCLQSSPSTN